jgi:serine/threonine protein kinase
MAPEILMEGKQGKPADVYAFGVVLYELYTARKPFGKIPRMTLGHKVVFEHLRPSFPPSTPPQYRILAEKCWHPDAASRPSFDQVLTELEQLTSISKSSKVGMHEISVQESIEEGVAVAHFAKEASFTSRKDKSTAGEEGSIDASVNASWFKNELWRARAPAQLHQKP